MRNLRNFGTSFLLLVCAVTFGCKASGFAGAPSEPAQGDLKYATDTSWSPRWNTAPDEGRQEKAQLTPTLFFVEDGFRGSPVPHDKSERKKESKNQEDFIEAFRKQAPCFGLTFKVKNSKDADFGLQVFRGLDGRTNRWQWVLYRMDTMGINASGEGTGPKADGIVDSVCSCVRDALLTHGGNVE